MHSDATNRFHFDIKPEAGSRKGDDHADDHIKPFNTVGSDTNCR